MINKFYIIKNILTNILGLPIYWLSGFIPKKRSQWVFSCWEGYAQRGNVKYLYEYVCLKHPEINPFWFTKSAEIFKSLKSNKLKVLNLSPRYWWTILRSSTFFVSHGAIDLPMCLTRNSTIINLGHTTYPIKYMGHKPFEATLKSTIQVLESIYTYMRHSDFYVVSSPELASHLAKNRNIPLSRVLPLGLPKIQRLLENTSADCPNFLKKIKRDFPTDKIILFLPTWRANPQFSLFNYEFDPEKLEKTLRDLNGHLIVNYHPFHQNKQSMKGISRLHFAEFKDEESNQMLAQTDVLITDYSAIFADFCIFHRPIIFAWFDKDNYLVEHKLDLQQEDLPGPVVSNWPQLVAKINQEILSPLEVTIQKREYVCSIVKGMDATKACSRIVEFSLDNVL